MVDIQDMPDSEHEDGEEEEEDEEEQEDGDDANDDEPDIDAAAPTDEPSAPSEPFDEEAFQAQMAARMEALRLHKALGNDDPAEVDESYVQALEHGLPPTGGWGCGVDRLVMLFSGAQRIGDVLSFGNLRNVVSLRQAAISA